MKKLLTVLVAAVSFFTISTAAFAQPSIETLSSQEISYVNGLFKEYAKELRLEENELYKEVALPDGKILFTEVNVHKVTPNLSNALYASNNQETQSMTSSQGYKNIFGVVLYKLDYTTVWTYDQTSVNSSYSYTAVHNGAGWSFKDDDSFGPVINDGGREHQWTGTAKFAIIVAGIDINVETLINHHRVRHDGTYSWKYELID